VTSGELTDDLEDDVDCIEPSNNPEPYVRLNEQRKDELENR
jgi:hypothetical protein